MELNDTKPIRIGDEEYIMYTKSQDAKARKAIAFENFIRGKVEGENL